MVSADKDALVGIDEGNWKVLESIVDPISPTTVDLTGLETPS